MESTSGVAIPGVEEQLRAFIVRELLYGEDSPMLNRDLNLVESGVIDSLGVLRLVKYIHDTFGVSIPSDRMALESFESLAAICQLLLELRSRV
jgi:acyl carrier protein